MCNELFNKWCFSSWFYFTLRSPYVLPAVRFLWMMIDAQDVEQECKQTENITRSTVFPMMPQNCTRHDGDKDMLCTEHDVQKERGMWYIMGFILLLSLVECTIQSIQSFTSSSLSSPGLLKPSSGCTYTWTPLSSVSQDGLYVSWCELERVDSCCWWASLWQSQSSFWWVETTPSSGMLVTKGVWFFGSWGDRRKQLKKKRKKSSLLKNICNIRTLKCNHLPYFHR